MRLLVGALSVVVLVSCAPPAPPAPLNPRVKVTAVDGGIVANVPLYEGLDKGYYSAEGIDLTLVPLSDASTSAQMIATNQAQFYVAVPDPVIFNALSRGVGVKVLLSSTTNAPTDHPAALMVHQDLIESGRYKSAADLKGMTIAAGAVFGTGELYYQAINKKDAEPASVLESLMGHTLVKDASLYQVMGVPSLGPNGSMDASSWDPFQEFYGAAPTERPAREPA